nr:MAG TPA: hypothetical protein [Caudoviricetes sp.]
MGILSSRGRMAAMSWLLSSSSMLKRPFVKICA